MIFDDTGEYYFDMAVDEKLGQEEIDRVLREKNITGLMPRHSVIDFFTNEGPMITSMENLITQFPDHPHYPTMLEYDIKQIIGGPMKVGQEVIGMLCFLSSNDNGYNKKQLPFFQAIVDQLSVATSNVLANQRVLEEKQFKRNAPEYK